MKKLLERLKTNNDGAAMISVMVVSIFVIVLATTMLYFTSMNFQMKGTDYQNTQAFYKGEQALDVIKSILVVDVSSACKKAYKDVMTNYAEMDSGARKDMYATAYVNELSAIWNKRMDTNGDNHPDISATEALIKLIEESANSASSGYLGISSTTKDEIIRSINEALAQGAAGINLVPKPGDGQFIIENLKVLYRDNGFESWLSTDYGLMLPDYNVDVEASASGTSTGRKTVNMSDSVIFMNWTRE